MELPYLNPREHFPKLEWTSKWFIWTAVKDEVQVTLCFGPSRRELFALLEAPAFECKEHTFNVWSWYGINQMFRSTAADPATPEHVKTFIRTYLIEPEKRGIMNGPPSGEGQTLTLDTFMLLKWEDPCAFGYE